MTSRPTVLASAVLALALLGDSLLYAVLPLHGTTFGISLAWIGVLLSVNRIARLFTGIRPALAILGASSLLAIPLAMLIPDSDIGRTHAAAPSNRGSNWRVTRSETLAAVVGLVADGIFPTTIALLLAPSAGMSGAAVATGTLLAIKRGAVIVLSPISGRAAERFGACVTTATGVSLTAAGAFLIAWSSPVGGAVLLVCGAAVTTTTIPLNVTSCDARARLAALARLGTARDAGAAAGPLVAMAMFNIAGAPLLYIAAGMLLVGSVLGSSNRRVAR